MNTYTSAKDYLGNVVNLQSWGNSLCNGLTPFLSAALGWQASADYGGSLGFSVSNGGVGGDTGFQIKTRFDAGYDTGLTSSGSGLPLVDQRKKTTIVGDIYTNGDGTDGSGNPVTARSVVD